MINLNYLKGLYSVSDIQEYFEYIIKKHEPLDHNPSIRINENKIKSWNTFTIKTGYYFELLTPEAIKLLGSNKSKINNDKNGGSMSHLEINEVVVVHCNIVNNDYPHDSRVLYTVIANKAFGQFLDISPKNFNG